MSSMLLSFPGNEALGEGLRTALGTEAVRFSMRHFPDGETYVRIDSQVEGLTVAILCSLHDPDMHFLPLVFLADTLHELGARSVGLIAPYLAYMRQDRRFQPGEALTSTSFARLLSARFDWLITVDPHLHRRHSLGEIYTIPTEVVHAAPLLAEWIRNHVAAPVVIGPDAESEQWVREVAEAVPCPFAVLEKTRRGDREVEVSAIPNLDQWAGRTPVFIDDIISSAHTMIEAVRQLRERHRAEGIAPICVGVHGVFSETAYEMLRLAGPARIVTTNSIAHPTNAIDLSTLLAAPVRRRLSGGNDVNAMSIARR
ncbi:MAG TPA: ribose-phosphate pyrophosphokinase [Steroidobacteraceae bacterium]|nr:ribose-phosphate pyrophosphokinase [Steroidobacteraceae bacterium]